jgi:hypothetical protein
MNYTIELLISGDEQVVSYYQVAKAKWKEIFEDNPNWDVEALAKELSTQQFWFESHCGGRFEGQEIMVVVGIGQFYSTLSGFKGDDLKKARLVYEAFRKSFCSLEVKGCAEEVATNYFLLEE